MAISTKFIRKYPHATLAITALLAGLVWRLELEHHGWKGLIWLEYFHWAIPVAFGLLLGWANHLLELLWWKRLVVNVLALVYACILYYILRSSLYHIYGGHARDMAYVGEYSMWRDLWYVGIVLVPLAPVTIGFMLRIFELKVPRKYVVMSIVGMVLSVPLAIVLLAKAQHKGAHDVIHTLKSGFVIPFWIYAIGLLFIGATKTNTAGSITE